MKEKGIAYILWALGAVGICGAHRMYTGKIGTGLLYFFTFGLLGVGQLIDAFLIPRMVEDANNRILLAEMDSPLLGQGRRALPGRRAPRTTEEFQVALVQAAERNNGRLTLPEAVKETGRNFTEVKKQLDEMAVNGFIELDSDEEGNAFYHFPGLGA